MSEHILGGRPRPRCDGVDPYVVNTIGTIGIVHKYGTYVTT